MASVRFQNVAPSSEARQSDGSSYNPDLNGFDKSATPPWQMVPVSDSRFVQITVLGPKTWSVNTWPSGVASVTQESGAGARNNVYRIDGGLQERATMVFVKDPKGQIIGCLEVRVMQQRTMNVQFFLVSDNARHHTNTKESDVRAWVDDANDQILSRQLNLTFSVKAVRPLPISQDLGDPVDFGGIGDMPYVPRRTPEEKRWHAIADNGDTDPSVFNVFCLWDFKGNQGTPDFVAFVESNTPLTADDMAKSGANYNMCMMKDPVDHGDWSTPGYIIFAHEAGHYLEGKAFHYEENADPHLLMVPAGGLVSRRLTKRDTESMTRRW